MSISFLSIFNASISACWLVLVVIALRFLLKRAPKSIRCALWALVAVRLICPVSIESPVSLMPSARTVSPDYLYEPAVHSTGQTVLDIVENPIYPENLNVTIDAPVSRVSVWDMDWTFIWIIGMSLMAAYLLISWLRLRRQVAASIPIARDIRLCDHVESPFILGILRPIIYLPSDISQEVLDHVLAHEKAHIARKDHWWKPLGFLLLTIHWFNPLLWLAYILLCRDIELACDEKVIRHLSAGQKKTYSAALLACSVSRPMIAACPLAFGEVGVKERVKNVLSYKKPAFWIIMVAVIACIAVAVCFLTDPPAPDAWDVMYQNGYIIQGQQDLTFDIVIHKNALPEDAFSEEGHRFREKEYIVYSSDNSTVWLMNVQYANEGDDKMYFEFNITHDISKFGTLVLPQRVEAGTNITSGCFRPTDGILYDGDTAFEDAVSLRARGPDQRFTVYIDTEAVRAAEQELRFEVAMNLLVYKKGEAALPEPTADDFELTDGTYVQQEKIYWAIYSSLYCYDMEMEVQDDALTLRFNDGEWTESPLPLEGRWQTECPISDRYREMLAELADIEPAFAMEDLSGCRFLDIDPSHFLVEKNGELYVVSWMRSNTALEIMNYIFHVVPHNESSATVPLGTATLDLDPVEDVIRQTILERNPFDSNPDSVTTVCYQPLQHAIGCGQDGSDEIIHMMVRLAVYEKDGNNLRQVATDNFQAAIHIATRSGAEPEVTAYWQSNTDTQEMLEENFGQMPDDLDPTGTNIVQRDLECARQAALHFGLDVDALQQELDPRYFELDSANGLQVFWSDTPDGIRCGITDGVHHIAGNELSSLETYLILRTYSGAEITYLNLVAGTETQRTHYQILPNGSAVPVIIP